jgi:hypothetical protein
MEDQAAVKGREMRYLVQATRGPSFTSVEQIIPVLENLILPGLKALVDLESRKVIVAGGVPVGQRSLVFIIEAVSHDALDAILQRLPLWPLLTWEVTPLQDFQARADHEGAFAAKVEKGMR